MFYPGECFQIKAESKCRDMSFAPKFYKDCFENENTLGDSLIFVQIFVSFYRKLCLVAQLRSTYILTLTHKSGI